jgi:hypothetical protein
MENYNREYIEVLRWEDFQPTIVLFDRYFGEEMEARIKSSDECGVYLVDRGVYVDKKETGSIEKIGYFCLTSKDTKTLTFEEFVKRGRPFGLVLD